MAYDDRHDFDRPRSGSNRDSEREAQARQSQRLGDRHHRAESDDPDYGSQRYGSGQESGYGASGVGSDGGAFYGAPGYDASFGGPRFDRLDVGSTGTHGVHPISSPFGGGDGGSFGISSGGGYGSSARRYAEHDRQQQQQGQDQPSQNKQGRRHDPHYAEWRSRQIEQLDRDYHEYRSENQARFEQEFGNWRERRSGQRRAIGRVSEKMEVVGSDGSHVGTVDGTRGDRIILTRSDANAGGHHHSVPCGWIETVDDKVTLNLTAEDATRRWRDEERGRALFEREDAGQDGPHILNRAFSGTYDEGDRSRSRD